MTQRQYIEYLIATPGNYTCTHLADHLAGEAEQSQDAISDFLRQQKLTPRRLWDVVAPLLCDGPHCYLIFDDSVQDKRYSHRANARGFPEFFAPEAAAWSLWLDAILRGHGSCKYLQARGTPENSGNPRAFALQPAQPEQYHANPESYTPQNTPPLAVGILYF